MAEKQVRVRSEVDPQYKWNAESVFASPEVWEAEFRAFTEELPKMHDLQGRLAKGPAVLADAFELLEALYRRGGQLYMYALVGQQVDLTDQEAAARASRARGLMGQLMAAVAFFDPELLELGQETLTAWLAEEPRLAQLAHYVDNLFRRQAHVRSAEVETVLGLLADPFSGPESIAGVLTNADFQFEPAVGSDGAEYPLTQGTLNKLLENPDREVRRTAWEHYADQYLAFKNTLATTLTTSIKQDVFQTRTRRHPSTLEKSLFALNVPTEVFYNLIDTFRQNLPTWHRYWALRRKILGVETLHPYDIWAPLTESAVEIPYLQAVDWICEGLAPMGEEYVATVRRGCLEQRWVDVYPTKGKTAGAFSAGWPGTYPFIVMNYNDSIFSLSTLAHELGHSLHSYLTWQNQPIIYSQYSLFVAEVASNFHQALVRAHLLETQTDPRFQINLIEEAMSNFHRYFFIMPTLARFELEAHERVERGEGLTADGLIALMAELFAEGYGDEMAVDHDRVGITWATFGHLYEDYYVYKYATGIAGANALAKRVLAGEPDAVTNYQRFLAAGASCYPLEALQLAGVDLTQPEPVDTAFDVLASLVDRLEALTS